MTTHSPATDDDNEPDESRIIDANTTLDIFIGPNKSIIELADTIDTIDGVTAETIDITNEKDGTHLEVISIEEPAAGQSTADMVDNFVTVEGIGPDVAALLIAGGIRTFKQLANTPVERIRQILEVGGPRFRIHDAAEWPERADKLQQQLPQRRAVPE
ncbi:hypothetical protein [uncultured Fibrella sp.]|uniref:hypothetical protein n=1 Tax=uncultured Fibrella sp. TaxID=1284596 RepID=UPI0035CB757E